MEKLQLLLLEDISADGDLMVSTLESSGIDFNSVSVRNEDGFIRAINEHTFDAILADNSLPGFSAIEALRINNERNIDIPFILVTRAVSEEFAVEIMKEGACDYVLKDHLQRLPNALLGAVHKFQLQKERKKFLADLITNETLLEDAAKLAHFGSWDIDNVNNAVHWSDEQFRIFGLEPGEIKPSLENFLNMVHPGDREVVQSVLGDAIQNLDRQKFNCRIICKNGLTRFISAELAVKRDESRNPLHINGFVLDVTDAKQSELKEKKITDDLLQRNKDLEQFAYIISHNLRGQVANIVGISNALIEGKLDQEENKEFVDALSVSVKRLDDIITDLNHILQVKHHVNENKELVVFSEIVEEMKSTVAALREDKSITIISDFTELDRMSTLKSYIRSIFYNLISNSIKFRKPGLLLVIEIKSRAHDGMVEISLCIFA